MIEKINKNLIPISIVIAGIIIAIAFIFVNQEKIKGAVGEVLPAEVVAGEAINYINENLLSAGMTASLLGVSDEGGVYKISLEIKEGEVLLGEFDSLVSKDGKFLFPEGGINMKEPLSQGFEGEGQDQTETLPLLPEELQEFAGCLAQAGFVIYGANWCGWTQQLVEMLGSWETVTPIYVECTQEEDLCLEKEISGYPTILIGDKEYEGSRTFEGFSGVTDCQIPEGAEFLNQNNSSGGC